MTIRPMTDADLDRVADLESELFGPGAWSRAMLDEEFHAPNRRYLVSVGPDDACATADVANSRGIIEDGGAEDGGAEDGDAEDGDTTGGEVRGYAGYWFDGDDAELMTIGVVAESQGRGIATALLTALIDDATHTTGAQRMLLEVRTDNEPALAVYRKLGFYRIGLRRHYYQPENKDAYTMALDLKPRVVGFAMPHQGATATTGIAQTRTAGTDSVETHTTEE